LSTQPSFAGVAESVEPLGPSAPDAFDTGALRE